MNSSKSKVPGTSKFSFVWWRCDLDSGNKELIIVPAGISHLESLFLKHSSRHPFGENLLETLTLAETLI
jgi:hypothetical protein